MLLCCAGWWRKCYRFVLLSGLYSHAADLYWSPHRETNWFFSLTSQSQHSVLVSQDIRRIHNMICYLFTRRSIQTTLSLFLPLHIYPSILNQVFFLSISVDEASRSFLYLFFSVSLCLWLLIQVTSWYYCLSNCTRPKSPKYNFWKPLSEDFTICEPTTKYSKFCRYF